jgi:hypothetical protein
MRRLLTATILLLLLLPAAAALAADNPSDLLVDACRDEKVDGTYSQRTYRRALDQLPADSDQYTACRDVINRARLAALDRKSNSSGGGSNTGSGSNSGGGGSTGSSGRGGGSNSAGTTTTPSCNGCKGSGTALDTATPAERRGVKRATATGGQAVRIGGEALTPGAVGSLTSDSRTLPTPLIVLLALVGAVALAFAGVAGWNRVLARRAR